MWSYIRSLLVGMLGAALAFGGYQGYILYLQHQALWTWAATAEQRIQKLTPTIPVPKAETIKK